MLQRNVGERTTTLFPGLASFSPFILTHFRLFLTLLCLSASPACPSGPAIVTAPCPRHDCPAACYEPR